MLIISYCNDNFRIFYATLGFILSIEIIIIALGMVMKKSLLLQIMVVSLIAGLLMGVVVGSGLLGMHQLVRSVRSPKPPF